MTKLVSVQPLLLTSEDLDLRGLHISNALITPIEKNALDFRGSTFYKCVFLFPIEDTHITTIDCNFEVLSNALINLNFDTEEYGSDVDVTDFGQKIENYLESYYPYIVSWLSINADFNVTHRNPIRFIDNVMYGYKIKRLGIANIKEVVNAIKSSAQEIKEYSMRWYGVYRDSDLKKRLIAKVANILSGGEHAYNIGSLHSFFAVEFHDCNFDQSDWRYFSSNIYEIESAIKSVCDSVEVHSEILRQIKKSYKFFSFKRCSFIGAKGINRIKSLPYFEFDDCTFGPFQKEEDYTSMNLRMSVLQNYMLYPKDHPNFRAYFFKSSYILNVAFKGLTLTRSEYAYTLFKNVTFEFTRWDNVSVYRCTFINCNFNNASFEDLTFNACSFINCTFNEIFVEFSQEYIDRILYHQNPSLFTDPTQIDNIQISIKNIKDYYNGFRVFKFSETTLLQVPEDQIQNKLETLDISNITYNKDNFSPIIKEANIIFYENEMIELCANLPIAWFSQSTEPLTKKSTMPNFDINRLAYEPFETDEYIDYEDEDLITVKRNRRKYRKNPTDDLDLP